MDFFNLHKPKVHVTMVVLEVGIYILFLDELSTPKDT